MAEKKESKGSRRYGNPPKIAAKKGGDEDKSGHEEKDDAAMKKSAKGGKGHMDSPADSGPEATEDSGTTGVPVERHMRERDEMVDRHHAEMKTMHSTHRSEMKTMHDKHSAEYGDMIKRQMDEHVGSTDEGDSGTEPD